MGADLRGINKEGLDRLILDIYNYADRINQILNSIDDLMIGSESYFKEDTGNKMRAKYALLRTNFSTVKKNIVSYADDLTRVRNNFENINKDLELVVQKHLDKLS